MTSPAPVQQKQPEPVSTPLPNKEEKKEEVQPSTNQNSDTGKTKNTIEVAAPEPKKELTPEELEIEAKRELEELENESETDNLYATEEYLDEEDKQEAEKQLIAEQDSKLGVANAKKKQAEEITDPLTLNWNNMLENVFAKIRTILYPLKNNPPTIKNNIIYVKVKGAIQEEHFNSKKREALAYWRNNVDEKIEDIIVETDETLEAPKMIYDNTDKLNHFKEENAEFSEFLNILNLKIKD